MGANMRRLAVTLAATNQGDVPVFKISAGKERCDSDKIAEACKSKKMTPVCAVPEFQKSKACWAATGKMGHNFVNPPEMAVRTTGGAASTIRALQSWDSRSSSRTAR